MSHTRSFWHRLYNHCDGAKHGRIGNRRGTTLFMCIAGTAALAVCGIFAQAARLRLIEAEVHRALAAEVAATLVASNPMSRRYGLACIDTSNSHSAVYDRLTAPVPVKKPAIKTFGEPLSDTTVLATAIDEYMRWWLPAILTTQTVARVRSVIEGLRQQNQAAQLPATADIGTSDFDLADALRSWFTRFDFTEFLAAPLISVPESTSMPITEEQNEPTPWRDEMRARIQAFLLDHIMGEELLAELRRMRDAIAKLLPVDAAPGNNSVLRMDLFDLTSISDFLLDWEQWLDVDVDPLYRKCAHVEYLMGVCARAVPTQTDNACSYATGLDGRDFRHYYPKEGADVERLITGCEQSERAENLVMAEIIGLRFVVKLAASFSDPVRKQKAHALAAALCGVVALISGGAVVLPEGATAIVILAVWSLGEAFGEGEQLKAGKGVALCPGLESIDLSYGDYLRILLYLIPDNTLMIRLTHILARNVPGCWARRVVVAGGLRARNIRVEGRCAA